MLILVNLVYKYGDIGPVRGVLNGLRPAVVALICSAGIGFITLALWNMDSIPDKLTYTIDYVGIIVLPVALVAIRRKLSVIKVLIG